MNQLVKERAQELRRRGYTYTQIAAHTGINRETIKSLCARANIHPQTTPAQYKNCQQCLQPLQGRATRFCSDTCRNSWWKTHPHRLDRKALYQFECSCCGKTFYSYGNKHRKYCGHPCYIKKRFKNSKTEYATY